MRVGTFLYAKTTSREQMMTENSNHYIFHDDELADEPLDEVCRGKHVCLNAVGSRRDA